MSQVVIAERAPVYNNARVGGEPLICETVAMRFSLIVFQELFMWRPQKRTLSRYISRRLCGDSDSHSKSPRRFIISNRKVNVVFPRDAS